jgi:hypothetical protein
MLKGIGIFSDAKQINVALKVSTKFLDIYKSLAGIFFTLPFLSDTTM